ncbi:MAG: MliC family protein [Spirochaetota bacterium]
MKIFSLSFILPCLCTSLIFAKPKPRHLPHYNDVRYTCASGRVIEARFILDEPGKVKLRLSDGRKLELPQAAAASGARYARKDETFIFWTKGEEAFVVENEVITYQDCTSNK